MQKKRLWQYTHNNTTFISFDKVIRAQLKQALMTERDTVRLKNIWSASATKFPCMPLFKSGIALKMEKGLL